MAYIEPKPRKEFEKPKAKLHLAVLADVISYKNVNTPYGVRNQSQYVWLLEAKDSRGEHFQVRSKKLNDSVDPGSDMYKLSTSVRNGTPIPVKFDPDSLIGSVNVIGVILVPGKDKFGNDTIFVNVSSVNPADEGQTLAIPAGFVRDKDVPRDARGYKIRTQQTAPAQQQATQQSAASVAAAPAAVASEDDGVEIEL